MDDLGGTGDAILGQIKICHITVTSFIKKFVNNWKIAQMTAEIAVSRISIFCIIIVHDKIWKINAEICSIFARSIDMFLAKVRHGVTGQIVGVAQMQRVRLRRTLCSAERTNGCTVQEPVLPGRDGKWYILQLSFGDSLVSSEQIRFCVGKESLFSEKNEIPPCVLYNVMLLCIR